MKMTYEERVQKFEDEGMTRSDAQGCVDAEDHQCTCTSCGELKEDVQQRYSFGIYAGRLCTECCSKYRDNCGIGESQGRVEDLDEFERGGYDAIDGDY